MIVHLLEFLRFVTELQCIGRVILVEMSIAYSMDR
jgi:hypothetical protein